MKDLEEANYIIGIRLLRDCKNKMLGLSQAAYIDKILVKSAMQDSKKELLHFRYKSCLSKDQSPRNHEKIDRMR